AGRTSFDLIGASAMNNLRPAVTLLAWLGLACLAAMPSISTAQEERPTIPALIKALKDSDPSKRRTAAESLGRLEKAAKDAVPQLEKALKDDDEGVRRQCVTALGRIGA